MAEVTESQPGSTIISVTNVDEVKDVEAIMVEGQGSGDYKLQCSSASQYQTVPLKEVSDFWGLVTMVAPEHEQDDRSGIDCVCVMDVSGSMQGDKISLVRKSMRRLVKCLSAKDRVCLVTFDTNVTTVMDFTKMDAAGKEMAKNLIKKLRAGSSTNLVGGLTTGIEKLRTLFEQGTINEVSSVLLFTDGQANVGVQSPEGILREAIAAAGRDKIIGDATKWSNAEVLRWLEKVDLPYKASFESQKVDGMMLINDITSEMLTDALKVTPLHLPKFTRELKKLRDQTSTSTVGEEAPHLNVTVNTFGFGAQHNNDLLDKIATEFDGMYYYMQDEKTIVGGFANCLGGMLSTVAQELAVVVRPGKGVTNLKVHQDEHVTTNSDGSIRAVIGDLQSEESQDVLISCTLPAVTEPDEAFQFFTCEVHYKNLVEDTHEKEFVSGIVGRTGEKMEGVNIKLDVERNRVFATEAMDRAKKLGDMGKFAEGRKIITNTLDSIKESPSANESFVSSLQGDLRTSFAGMRDRTQYMSIGKGYMKQNVRCHKKKRAANFSRSYASQSHYQTSSRSRQYERFSKADSDDSDDEETPTLSVPTTLKAKRKKRRPRKNKTAPSMRRKQRPEKPMNIIPPQIPPPVLQQNMPPVPPQIIPVQQAPILASGPPMQAPSVANPPPQLQQQMPVYLMPSDLAQLSPADLQQLQQASLQQQLPRPVLQQQQPSPVLQQQQAPPPNPPPKE